MSLRTPVISLGAGVQSSVLLLMAAAGEFGPVPPLAVFADTQHEPASVMHHLDWLTAEVAGRIEVVRVTEGDLLAEATRRTFNPIPLYVRQPDGQIGVGRRQCTKEFKLYAIRHELRRRRIDLAECWIGITVDEVERAKPSGLQWLVNRHPLLEQDPPLSRVACQRWLRDYGVPHEVPKSACYFCPYKSPRDFAVMRDTDPESFELACRADEAMRDAGAGREQFVLKTCEPLRTAVLDLADVGQQSFGDECEGMCGV